MCRSSFSPDHHLSSRSPKGALQTTLTPNLALDLPPTCYAATGSVEAWVEGLARQLRPCDAVGDYRVDWSQALVRYQWSDVAAKTLDIYRRVWRGGDAAPGDTARGT